MNGPEERQEMQFEMDDPQMREFEQALSRAMQRVEVRAETTAKLLALAEDAENNKRVQAGGGFRLIKFSDRGRVFAMSRLPQARAWMGGAIAAVLAMGVFVGTHVHEKHERRVAAQQQFETAERITDAALARTRAELEQRGINLDQQ